MPATPQELCEQVDCICASGIVQNDTFKILVLQMLCNIMGVTTAAATPPPPPPENVGAHYGQQ